MQAAEALVLVGVVGALYWALSPVRRRLERAIRGWLSRGKRGTRGRVITLARRQDGTFERREGR